MSSGAQGDPPRLRPEMSSRRLQVLAFIQDYIARYNGSPSIGEIAAGCGIGRTRARQHVGALVRDGLVLRRGGPRGLFLPSAIEDAKRRLREVGFIVDEDFLSVGGSPCPDSTLLPRPVLDYLPDGKPEGAGDEVGGQHGHQGGTRARGS